MPRKRTTRAQKGRSKPELKEADENGNALSAKEKAEKLQRYLQDFDIQVETMLKKFKTEELNLQRVIKKHFNALLVGFSPRQRAMTVEEYCAEVEEMEKLEQLEAAESAKENDEIVDHVGALPERATRSLQIQEPLLKSEQFGNICQTLSKYRSQPKRMIDTIPEEGGGITTTQKKTRKGAKKGQGVTFNAEPAPSTLPRNSRFITPAHQKNLSALGMNTPLITPKFDPRLPITPAQKRTAKPGETFVSLAGSPIQGPKERTITLPVPEGQEFDQLLEDYAVLDDLKITDTNKSHMSKVMNMLTSIMRAQREEKDT